MRDHAWFSGRVFHFKAGEHPGQPELELKADGSIGRYDNPNERKYNMTTMPPVWSSRASVRGLQEAGVWIQSTVSWIYWIAQGGSPRDSPKSIVTLPGISFYLVLTSALRLVAVVKRMRLFTICRD
jgi:hypothetical protein